MKRVCFFAIALFAVSAVQAAELFTPETAPPIDAKSAVDIASYGIGLQIANNFKNDGVEVNLDQLILGLKDASQGAKPRYADPQLQAAFQAFGRLVQAKQEERNSEAGEKNKREGTAFLADNGKKPGVKTLASGLQYQVVKAGQGASPKASDTVRVNYEGTLLDGKVFDSSIRSGRPATFRVDGVIPGWTEALQLMHVGDKWRIFVPSELAYGANGAGNVIAPHSVLIFDVELLGID
ncbi:MAG: FKBP-type peptidyl-prolyl cis-trans isomerase [Candidatus Anammoximicrobium sp.]|nr:FKBP-type peptidyl-prolyl cis-trans isomerase [Candidatus Anammoximicrobium sp.]